MTEAGQRIIAGAKEALSMVQAMKPADTRPANGAWAPGSYMDKCMICDCHFLGDKRALVCADCAYDAVIVSGPAW